MSINRVNISGNLGRDPELRSTVAGTNILTFTLAVSDRRKNPQTQQWEEVANWIPCVLFGQRANALSNILSKGMKCAVEGKLRWSQWERDGQKRSKIEVIVDEVEFLSRRDGENGTGGGQSANYTGTAQGAPNTAPQAPQNAEYYADDCPF